MVGDSKIDVAFGGEMAQSIGPHLFEYLLDSPFVAYVSFDESIARIAVHRTKRVEVTSIRQFVDIDYLSLRVLNQMAAYRRSDKARPAGNYNAHRRKQLLLLKKTPSCCQLGFLL